MSETNQVNISESGTRKQSYMGGTEQALLKQAAHARRCALSFSARARAQGRTRARFRAPLSSHGTRTPVGQMKHAVWDEV